MPKQKSSRFRKKEPMKRPKRKEKFNYRTAPYIKEREARNEEIESRRKRIEEQKARQQSYKDVSSEEEEENPLNELLQTFTGKTGSKKAALSDTDSENGSENENDTEQEDDSDALDGVEESQDQEDEDDESEEESE
ncbi:hypothetical protein QAD02_005777 [Eretmocerus hayati]|uniref:Uncharacterized protein n=1 Tax=Eretmocerus hayati TaxID=131215 RepID=A0ACC2NTC7_9HYME|nr:hypothetical protein QAD02_005777 [Eretmocerus hayati]